MKTFLSAIVVSLAASGTAQAVTYSATDIANTPSIFSTNGQFSTKDGWQSVGVGGVTGLKQTTSGEIDIGETITGKFGAPVAVDRIQLKFLYDGPEFGDVQETASFKVTFADATTSSFSFTAQYGSAPTGSVSGNYSFMEGASAVSMTASLDSASDGAWSLLNPFGNRAVSSIVFSALRGSCGYGACNNQSDYAIRSISVSPVPEPSTYALMLAGLLAVGFMSRRRSTIR